MTKPATKPLFNAMFRNQERTIASVKGNFPEADATNVFASTSSAADAALTIERLSNADAEHLVCSWFMSARINDNVQHERIASYVLDNLTEHDFSQPVYRNIYTTIQELVAQKAPCSPTAILDLAASHDRYVGSLDNLGQMQIDPIAACATEDGLTRDVKILREHTSRRLIRGKLQTLIDELHTKPVNITVQALSDEAQTLERTAGATERGPEHISVPMHKVVGGLMSEDSGANAVRTGLVDLDAALNGGFRDGELILVAGRPGMGKTAFAVGISRNIAIDHTHSRPVLFFSLEMKSEALASRMLAAESGVPAQRFRQGSWREDDPAIQCVADVLPRFQSGDGNRSPMTRFFIDDTPGLSLAEIRSRSRQFTRLCMSEYGMPPTIMVDYMQIVNQTQRLSGAGDDGGNRAVGLVSQGMKSLARELNTPVVALSQLNRSLEQRTNKRPMPSDLRESGSLEQDADIILFVYRDCVYNPDSDPHAAEIIIGKQREGAMGIIPVIYHNELVRFENWASRGNGPQEAY